MPQEIEFCAEYDVRQSVSRFQPVCKKGHKAGLKCHSEREDCPDYKPSIALTREEIKRLNE